MLTLIDVKFNSVFICLFSLQVKDIKICVVW